MQGFDYEPTRGYTPPYQQNGNRSLQVEQRPTERIIEVKQVSMAPSRSVTTPYVSRSKGAIRCGEQGESSHSQHSDQNHSTRRAHSPRQSRRRVKTATRIAPSTHPLFKRIRLRAERGRGLCQNTTIHLR